MPRSSRRFIGGVLLSIGTLVAILGNLLLVGFLLEDRFLGVVDLEVTELVVPMVGAGVALIWIGWFIAVSVP